MKVRIHYYIKDKSIIRHLDIDNFMCLDVINEE